MTGLLLMPAHARAEPASGWVDPPAKAEGGKAEDTKPAAAAPEPMKARTASKPTATEAAGRRSDRHAARAERRHHHMARRERSRLAVSPSENGTADPRFAAWAGQAQRLADDYLDSVSSSNDAMLSSASRFYGSQVRFHGRVVSLSALIAEKRRFVRRWPERRYLPQDAATRTTCNAATASCVVHTAFSFQAANPARGARSQGLSELVLTISFAGEHPVIVSESSRVLRRGSVALGPGTHGDGA